MLGDGSGPSSSAIGDIWPSGIGPPFPSGDTALRAKLNIRRTRGLTPFHLARGRSSAKSLPSACSPSETPPARVIGPGALRPSRQIPPSR